MPLESDRARVSIGFLPLYASTELMITIVFAPAGGRGGGVDLGSPPSACAFSLYSQCIALRTGAACMRG